MNHSYKMSLKLNNIDFEFKSNTLYVTDDDELIESFLSNSVSKTYNGQQLDLEPGTVLYYDNRTKIASDRFYATSNSSRPPLLLISVLKEDSDPKMKEVYKFFKQKFGEEDVKSVFTKKFDELMKLYAPVRHGVTPPQLIIGEKSMKLKLSSSNQLNKIAQLIQLKMMIDIFDLRFGIIDMDFSDISVDRRDLVQEMMRSTGAVIIFKKHKSLYTEIMHEIK